MRRPSSYAVDPGLGQLAIIPAITRRKTRVPTDAVLATSQVIDVASLISTGILVCVLSHQRHHHGVGWSDLLKAMLPAWVAWTLLTRLDGYALSALSTLAGSAQRIAAASLTGALCFVVCSIIQNPASGASIPLTIGWCGLAAAMLVGHRAIGSRVIRQWCREGRISRRVALVGTEDECRRTSARLVGGLGCAVEIISTYVYDTDRDGVGGGLAAWQRSLAELLAAGGPSQLDAVVIAVPESDGTRIASICSLLGGLAIDIYADAPHLSHHPARDRLGVPAWLVAPRPLSAVQLLQKTLFDRVGALVVLIAVSPALALIAILIKLDSPGPVLFRQQRTGYHSLPFMCLKFRTMFHRHADDGFVRQAVRGDQRVTRIGRLLRRSSLDELPQLLNVVKGDMSLVGPRPHAPNTMAGGRLFPDIVSHYDHRHRVKPGITGWAQVNGSRGETPDPQSVERRVELDLFYIEHWSLLLDLKILLRTLLCLVHDPSAF